jgi:hypothetical protein
MIHRISLFIPIFVIVATLTVANTVIGWFDLPNYGVWTGIRPLEDKLDKLHQFVSDGPVDAIVFGSSIADFGFSAQLYSELMSKKLGYPYRVFNFSSGGVEASSVPAFLKLALTEAKPKEVILVLPAQYKRPNKILEESPDHALAVAPVGQHLESLSMLSFYRWFWRQPIAIGAAALRDQFLYGGYHNLKLAGGDTYEVTAWGDRISFQPIQDKVNVQRLRKVYEENIIPYTDEKNNSDRSTAVLDHFLPIVDIEAMRTLHDMADEHDFKISIFAHASAATLLDYPSSDARYRQGRQEYFDALASLVNTKPVYILDNVAMPYFALMDDTHLNHYGAGLLTQAIFDSMGVSRLPPNSINQSVFATVRKDDPTFNTWAAVLVMPAGKAVPTLTCRFVKGLAVPVFPVDHLYMALRLADGVDRIAPAVKVGDQIYTAAINLPPLNKEQIGLFRLLYKRGDKLEETSSPLASCQF